MNIQKTIIPVPRTLLIALTRWLQRNKYEDDWDVERGSAVNWFHACHLLGIPVVNFHYNEAKPVPKSISRQFTEGKGVFQPGFVVAYDNKLWVVVQAPDELIIGKPLGPDMKPVFLSLVLLDHIDLSA